MIREVIDLNPMQTMHSRRMKNLTWAISFSFRSIMAKMIILSACSQSIASLVKLKSDVIRNCLCTFPTSIMNEFEIHHTKPPLAQWVMKDPDVKSKVSDISTITWLQNSTWIHWIFDKAEMVIPYQMHVGHNTFTSWISTSAVSNAKFVMFMWSWETRTLQKSRSFTKWI